nr:transmembrane protein 132E [Hymenolepis microstoma]
MNLENAIEESFERQLTIKRFSTANNRNPSTGGYSHASTDGTSTSLVLDVTDLTAHCLRLEYVNEDASNLHLEDSSNAPARLVLVGGSSSLDDSGHVQAATRVWLVGQKPGRVRVKLASVADSPLVKVALPTSLAKLRKQQHQQNKGKENGWDGQHFQGFWVSVTNTDAVWPLGLSAQLVTDLTVTITQQERSEGKYSTTPFYHQSADNGRVESGFTFYTAHIRFSGSRVGRSKGFPVISNSGSVPDAFAFQRGGQFPDLSRTKRQLATKTLPRQGLLVVTVQFSDGSVLPWHRIMEVIWELGQQEAPFKLAVENLRPDLVRVDMPPMPTSSPPPIPTQLRKKRSSIVPDSGWFGYHGDAAPVNEGMNRTQPPQSRPEWLGPTVFLLREDESFIGDLLRVNLHSNVDNSLLFSAPVHARIEAARPSPLREDDGSSPDITTSPSVGEPLPPSSQLEAERKISPTHTAIETSRSQVDRFWPDPKGLSSISDYTDEDDKDSMRGGAGAPTNNLFDPNVGNTGSQWKKGWSHLPDTFDTQQDGNKTGTSNRCISAFATFRRKFGPRKPYDPKLAELFGSEALKDAPGVRLSSSYQRLLYPDSVDKSSSVKNSLDKENFVDRPNADSGLNEGFFKLAEVPIEGKDGVGASASGHRPALELIMYILLGLFILIALIFAVNCGAMVARYRWEHSHGAKENLRLQHLSELAMNNVNTDSAGTGECSSTSTADLQPQGDQIDNPSLSQQRINRDSDWIWLGRDALAESQHDTAGTNQLESRLLTAATSIDMSKNQSLTRSPLTPTVVPSPEFGTKSRLNAVSTPQQPKMSLSGSYHDSNTRKPTSQKNTQSTCATCHYEGEECSIRILTITMEPEKSSNSASRCSVASAMSSQHLLLPSIGNYQQSHLYRNRHSRYSSSNCRSHPILDQRRRSAFVFGQSFILDNQNPDWQFSGEIADDHRLQSQRCRCNRGLALPWRYRGDHREDSNRTVDNDPEAILSMLNIEGYQTLPSQMPVWQDGANSGSPPCPPLRTSSKMRPPMLMSYYGDQETSLGSMRPTSFPNKNSQQMTALLTTSVTNEIYSLLADSEEDATLTRKASARSYCPVNPNVSNQTGTNNKSTIIDLPRRTRSYSRIYNYDQTAIPPMNNTITATPRLRRYSSRGPPEPQSISSGNYHYRSIYANCLALPVPTTTSEVQSTTSESIS